MATRKITITLPEDLIDALNDVARADSMPVSRLVAVAVEHELRRRIGQQLIADWQAEHGAFTPAEIAAARAEMAAADAELLDAAVRTAA